MHLTVKKLDRGDDVWCNGRAGGTAHCWGVAGLVGLLLLATAATVDARERSAPDRDPSWALLSDNVDFELPRYETGATYELVPEATDPADGRRDVPALQDAEQPVANWHATIGWGSSGRPEAHAIFDLGDVYEIARIDSLLMSRNHPDAIRIEVREDASDEWREMGRTEVEAPDDSRFWTATPLAEPTPARYVKIAYEKDSGMYYVREAQIWGRLLGDDPQRIEPMDETNGALTLIADDAPGAAIVVEAGEGETGWAAARLLQDYLQRMTGVVLPVVEGTDALDERTPRILVGPEAARGVGVEIEQGYPHMPETYRLVRDGRSLVVAGNDAGDFRGSMLAVAHFLHEQGARFYRYDDPERYWIIPEHDRIAVDALDVTQAPAFATRRASTWVMTYAPHRDIWRILNRFGGVSINYGHRAFIGEEEYETNPEWFAYRDGERRNPAEHRNWQLCTTNAEVIDLVVESVAERLARDPNMHSASLSSRDRPGFCQCEECEAIEGNLGDRWATFANDVRRELDERHPEFQDRKLMFYAYWHKRQPPQHTQIAPGVVVMFVADGCHAHLWTDDEDTCPNQHRMRNWFDGWREASYEAMGIYEWYIPGAGPGRASDRWEQFPWFVYRKPVVDALHLRDNGVRYLNYEQTKSMDRHSQFWLPYYMAARAMWDAEEDPEALLRELCDNLYGEASDTMFRLYRMLDQAMLDADVHTGSWRLPNPAEIYAPETIVETNHLFERALEETQDQELPNARVREMAEAWENGWEWLLEVDGPDADPLDGVYRE